MSNLEGTVPGKYVAWLAECQLATVEMLQERSRVSKSDLSRQQEIADVAVKACRDFDVIPRDHKGNDCTRLRRLLSLEET
jgi:hypothetical protein